MNRQEKKARLTQLTDLLEELGRTKWADRRRRWLERWLAQDCDGWVWLEWVDTGTEELLLFEEWAISIDTDGRYTAMHIDPDNHDLLKNLSLDTVEQIISALSGEQSEEMDGQDQ